jgi:hypothetical protein
MTRRRMGPRAKLVMRISRPFVASHIPERQTAVDARAGCANVPAGRRCAGCDIPRAHLQL